MELKTKYQYTYFIYPFAIKESKYTRYLLKLLKDENCKLRIFRKDKDLDIYSYFSWSLSLRRYFLKLKFSLESPQTPLIGILKAEDLKLTGFWGMCGL